VLQICNRQMQRLNDIRCIVDRAGNHKPSTPMSPPRRDFGC
jgi:hypothetical protein